MIHKHIRDNATHSPESHNLVHREMLSLHHNTFAGALRRRMDDDVLEKLSAHGLIDHRIGGPVTSHSGIALIIAQNGQYTSS